MNEFPLYDTLVKDISDKDITLQQKKDCITKLQSFNSKGYELLYVLIKIHSIKEGYGEILPYNGKFLDDKDIEFDIEQFPNKLKQMLYKFILLHNKAMKEEKSMSASKIDFK